jgi:integrase
MNACKVIKDISTIAKWELYIKKGVKQGKYKQKHYLLFLLGLGTGLQFPELINLKYTDLKVKPGNETSDGKEQMYIVLKSKYSRIIEREIVFPEKCKKLVDEIHIERPDEIYLFQSESMNKKNKLSSWTTPYVRRFLEETAVAAGISNDCIGVTMLRKSFGYFQLKYGDWKLRDLQRYFEMRSINLLREYLDLSDDEFN